MPLPRLQLLPWNQPLLPQAVAWLSAGWRGDAPLDLADQLVIAPTRQSGRRLREALAAHAATRGQGVFPPRVILPELLLSEGAAAADLASPAETLLAWIEVLRTIALPDFAEVFPVAPPERSLAWAARLAREFLRLQATLGENGLRLRDPADTARFGPFPETARWRQLGVLEGLYDAALARRGRRDPQAARIAFADAPTPPAGVRRIVILATPDPPPLLTRALERMAATLPVVVVIFGPAAAIGGSEDGATGADAFDAWGRPRIEAWRRVEPDLPDFEDQVHLCADPSAQADHLVARARAYAVPDRVFALGVADAEILAPLQHAMQRAGITTFDPEGRARRGEPLHRVLELTAEFAREPLWATVAALARCPDVLAWLRAESGTAFSSAQLLVELDRLQNEHLPTTLDAARHYARSALAHMLEAMTRLRGELLAHPFPENARRVLALLYGARTFDLADPEDARDVATAAAWNKTAGQFAAAAEHFGRIAGLELLELAREAFGDSMRFETKAAGALDLQGWLELLWEDAPHVVVAGLNDGRVPDAVVGDPFLPEALRERLGLATNAARLARDAYVFAALAACRRGHGRLDVLFGKVNHAGDPLRPSRLLLASPDDALPQRVAFLFRGVPDREADAPWRRAFALTPPAAPPVTHLSVTSFRNYLRCPFRFYLNHALKLRTVEPDKTELNDLDFGQLCHQALEALGQKPRLRDCTDAAILRELLLAEFDDVARARLGSDVPVPVLVQFESARQRLARAAAVQARERAEGWVIERTEWKFELPVGELTVRGTIDRIERHATTGAVRVLDYKTKDRATPPRESHVRVLGRNEAPEDTPEFARCTIGETSLAWLDLQLPLYLHALRAEFGDAVSCGYFLLPRAVSETAIVLWDDYAPAWHEASWRCATGIVAAVRAGIFWPPAEIDPAQDDFAALFHQGARESVAGPEAVVP